MSVTAAQMQSWCETLLAGRSGAPSFELGDYLAAIPRLDTLAELPAGSAVLVRGDVDAKPGAEIGQGDIRLRSMCETLEYGRQRGWKQIVFGHIGRKPEGSLDQVAARLGELLATDVPLIKDWLDESTMTIADAVTEHIESAPNGAVIVLENTRQYDIERVLWKAKPEDLPQLSERLASFANQLAEKVARVYVNEALSAGSLDASSTVAPIAMDQAVLGSYVASEFDGPMQQCLQTQLVIFSGLKIDKLDDLEAMIQRGKIRGVFAAGSLAMALRKAAAQLDGAECSIGVAEDPEHADKPYYIPPPRIEQAKQMIREGREKGIEFVIPVDSVRADGSVVDALGPSDQQLDIGPQTSALFEAKIGEFLDHRPANPVAFHNGVFGMFEDPRFAEGTKRFVPQLKRLKEGGVEVYVGGGEGGKALEKYGEEDWVTHVFTAGGTVLNALGSEPVPYLVALRAAAQREA